jgi:Xaa-Pro aminopeptidase
MFRAHRENLMAKVAPGSVVVLRSAPERVFSHDTDYPYRQDSDFYYLTGLAEPDSIAVLRPGASDGKRYVLFVRPRDSQREGVEGGRPGPEGAMKEYGADAAFPTADFSSMMARFDRPTRSYSGYLASAQRLYLSDGGDEEWARKFHAELAAMRRRDAGPATLIDARESIHELRLVKDADEIALMRRAAEISARGHVLAMKAASPDKYEFEVQAALDGYCLANGAHEMSYPSIVGSGPDSIVLHWHRNDRQMKAGEVLLIDAGGEYDLYATDITRTFPVSGRFSPEQRAVYEVVLAAQKAAIARIRPGVPHDEIEKTSARAQTEGLVRLGLLSGEVDRLIADQSYRRFTVHGVSHWVGLDVHDANPYKLGDKSRPLEPGMVLTVEPGIYIPAQTPGVDPKWWNIGVRIEDTLLVTRDGSECLSCGAPKEIAEVERTVQSKDAGGRR